MDTSDILSLPGHHFIHEREVRNALVWEVTKFQRFF